MDSPRFTDDWTTIYNGDCLEVMRGMEACSIDAIVTDPPYGLSFMGREWDHGVPGEAFWAEALRVAKPGAHLVAFGGTRTYHRLAVAIEDAGWEVRDCLGWLYGSGFPKSLDVSKAIDKRPGVEFSAKPASGVGFMRPDGRGGYNVTKNQLTREGESTEAAAAWQGWGTALKPAWEPVILARKPLTGTVAANVQRYGTGAINVDGCRVDAGGGRPLREVAPLREEVSYAPTSLAGRVDGSLQSSKAVGETTLGRWPANIVHDGSDEVLAVLGDQARFFYTSKASSAEREGYLTCDCETVKLDAWVKEVHSHNEPTVCTSPQRDTSVATSEDVCGSSTSPCGSSTTAPSRPDLTFTTPTATSKTTESRTCDSSASSNTSGSTAAASCATASGTSHAGSVDQCSPSTPSTGISPQRAGRSTGVVVPVTSPLWSGTRRCAVCGSAVRKAAHPTQKPLDLMRWLVRLVTPPDGVVLDPFMGSGTTLKAARAEGHRSIGIDLEHEHCEIAWGRLSQGVLL